MDLTAIAIAGNRRFLYAGINEIELTPQARQQLILGTNGSGKSTLLDALSPLPASPGDYIKGGYKETQWTDGTVSYKLRSSFVRGEHPHSFLRNGVELNDGGTLMIQRKLVEQYFNYTTDLHELLIGNVKFTSLTAQKRKEWLVKLCHVDVSYAIGVYLKLQTTARNVLGARKHAEQRIIQRTAQLLGETELADLKQRLDEINQELKILVESKDYELQWSESNASELRYIEAQLQELSQEILSMPMLDTEGFKNTTEIQTAIDSLIEHTARLEERNNGIKKEYSSISDIVKMLSQSSTVSIQDLENECGSLQQANENEHLNTRQSLLCHYSNLKEIQSDLEQVIDPIEDLLLEIPLNTDMKLYNNEIIQLKQEARDKVLAEKHNWQNRHQTAISRLHYLKSHDPVVCPECTHSWIPGVSDVEVERLENSMPKYEATIAELDKKLIEFHLWYEQKETWKHVYLRYRNYVSQYPRLKEIWDYYQDEYRIFNEPAKLVGFIRHFYNDVIVAIRCKSRQDRVDVLHSAIEERRLLESNNVVTLNGKLTQLDTELSVGLAEVRLNSTRIDSLRNLYDGIQTLESRSRQIKELLNHHVEGFIKQFKDGKNKIIDSLMMARQQSLSSLSTRHHDAMSDVNMLAQYERDLEELKRSEEDLGLVLDSLSPTSGIIAQTLNSFINIFTQGMNKVISQVWTTPLQVLPCNMKDTDLDYKFPLWFGSEEKTADDISQGSSGQKEIVDFAFVLVARSFLKLNHIPLILDEVGRTFTDTHRRHLFDFIKLLNSQIFIVSHFSNTHGALNQADVNVIDPTGVLIREGYNKNFRLA